MDWWEWLFEPVFGDNTPGSRLAGAVVLAGLAYCGLQYAHKLFAPNERLRNMTQRLSKTDEIKTYGGGALQAQQLSKAYEFNLAGLRFDEEETHHFVATRKTDSLLALRFMGVDEENAGQLAQLATLLIGKTLDNTDGVPVQWSPSTLPRPKNAGDDYEPKFRGPDGKLHPMDQAAKFEEFDKGSSRRRWEALLVDNQFTCPLEVLVEITKDLIEMSSGNPTDG